MTAIACISEVQKQLLVIPMSLQDLKQEGDDDDDGGDYCDDCDDGDGGDYDARHMRTRTGRASEDHGVQGFNTLHFFKAKFILSFFVLASTILNNNTIFCL